MAEPFRSAEAIAAEPSPPGRPAPETHVGKETRFGGRLPWEFGALRLKLGLGISPDRGVVPGGDQTWQFNPGPFVSFAIPGYHGISINFC